MGNHTDDNLLPIQNGVRICPASVECDETDDFNSASRGESEDHKDDCDEVESTLFVKQRSRIESLERQLEEKNTNVINLEAHIKVLNNEIMKLRQSHEEEQRRQKEAYIELKRETTQIVTWLKRKIGQANSQDNDNDDDSLTPSERQSLAMEIEGEMVDWKKSLVVSSDEDMIELNIHSSASIDESTVTNPFSPI
jgi:predicted RNase H-like nuclease (RuvC/YqgF family)